jgi:hypothetical protein
MHLPFPSHLCPHARRKQTSSCHPGCKHRVSTTTLHKCSKSHVTRHTSHVTHYLDRRNDLVEGSAGGNGSSRNENGLSRNENGLG